MAQRAKGEAPPKPRRLFADPDASSDSTQGAEGCGKPKTAPRAAKSAAKNPAAGRKRLESRPQRPGGPSAAAPKTPQAGATPPRPANAGAGELAAAGMAAPAGIEAGAAQGAARHGAEPSLAQRLLALGRQTEMSSLEALRREKKLAWRIAVFNGALLAVSLTGYAFLLPLKQSVPYVVQVDKLTGETHLALWRGDLAGAEPPLVRVHEPFGALDFIVPEAGRSVSLPDALLCASQSKAAAVVLLHKTEDGQALLRRAAAAGGAREKWDSKSFGVGAQILLDLGIRRMRVLGSSVSLKSLDGFGLEVAGAVDPQSILGKIEKVG